MSTTSSQPSRILAESQPLGLAVTSNGRTASNRLRGAFEALRKMRSPSAMASLLPSVLRAAWASDERTAGRSLLRTAHMNVFDWRYTGHDDMTALYERAVHSQWYENEHLPWATDVDPERPESALVPMDFFDFSRAAELGIRLSPREQQAFRTAFVTWMLSQFLHGEQGALYAAAQAVEALPSLAAKKMAATQVSDEARHVAVFQRYLETKLHGRYVINDNLYIALDALIGESRWDLKFVGMQIIVEGLALTAFGNLQKRTKEPLLRALLHRVLQDEARHVQFGLLTLQEVLPHLSSKERTQREEWALELSLLLRDRFLAYELYEEWFAHAISRRQWRELLMQSSGMAEFQRVMYARLARHLKAVGLFGPRVEARFRSAGLLDAAARRNLEMGA